MQTTSGPPPAPKHTCPESLATVTIRPGDRDYDAVRHTYTRLGSPAAVIRVRDHQDIADTLAHARTTGVPVTARSGGHGISSRSTNDQGMVIDLSRLNTVEILDSRSGLVRVEAGARWGDVAAALAPHGLGLSSGDTGDVGVGGLATAGGIGLMSRLHGLTIDHMRAAELVLADGSLIRTDTEHSPDLFWAVRGAGTNFGVATAFEFQAQPVREVIVAMTVYDAADTAAFLTRWAAAVEAAPRLAHQFPDARRRSRRESSCGPGDDRVRRHRRDAGPRGSRPPIVGRAGPAQPRNRHSLPPAAARRARAAACAATADRVAPGLLDHITPPAAESMAALMKAAGMVQLRSVGAAVNDTPPTAMASSHRTQNFSLMAATVPALRDGLDEHWERLQPHLNGLYLSFETRTGRRQLQDAFPGPVLDRLVSLKAQYDPDHVFDNNFALPSVPFPH
ncbi:FAD-binding protein [Streptomyces canus]|uniref:FAD-dependent oxidoreductase n=1 Tax=Streptomyces canus TaxID=58343 RepID=UPI003248EF00